MVAGEARGGVAAAVVQRPLSCIGGGGSQLFVRRGLVFLLLFLLLGRPSMGFTGPGRNQGTRMGRQQQQQQQKQRRRRRHGAAAASSSVRRMVRNIDWVEALLFYGHASFSAGLDGADDGAAAMLLPGVEGLIEECRRDGTAVLAIVDPARVGPSERLLESCGVLLRRGGDGPTAAAVRSESSRPPNPRDLWEAVRSVQIQPRGFGGSSGFGRKAADPARRPLPQHCVVLCHNEDQCRAARYVGLRVLCLTDNGLADAVVDDGGGWESVSMDDIATPGSFWLNPPHPRDDEGNKVDPVSVMEAYERQGGTPRGGDTVTQQAGTEGKRDDGESIDEYLASVLNDMDPL